MALPGRSAMRVAKDPAKTVCMLSFLRLGPVGPRWDGVAIRRRLAADTIGGAEISGNNIREGHASAFVHFCGPTGA